MKVKYFGKTDHATFINDKVYEVVSIEDGWYRI